MWTKLLRSYINSVMTTWNIPDSCINTIEKWYYGIFTRGRNKAFMTVRQARQIVKDELGQTRRWEDDEEK